MKSLLSLFIIAASALSLHASNTKSAATMDAAAVMAAAESLMKEVGKDPAVQKSVDNLIKAYASGKGPQALTALQGLASMEFSKEQIRPLGKLVAATLPGLLSTHFDLEGTETGKYVQSAIRYLETENFAGAAEVVARAIKTGDLSKAQTELLQGAAKSLAPMLKGVNLNQALQIGSSLLDRGSKEEKKEDKQAH
jgi:hypothetical protein